MYIALHQYYLLYSMRFQTINFSRMYWIFNFFFAFILCTAWWRLPLVVETCSCLLTYKTICCFCGLFVGLAVIRSQFGPVKRHPKLKPCMCRNSSHKIMDVWLLYLISDISFGCVSFAVHKIRKSSWIISRMVEENCWCMLRYVTPKKL